MVAEYTADGSRFLVTDSTPDLSLTDTRTFGADGLVSQTTYQTSPSLTTFYTYDERGNVAQRTSSSGAAQSSDVYDGYGGRTSTGGADSVGFGGQWGYYTNADNGLILCTHRFYDLSNGRWLTRDPMGYAGGVNLYGYVGNDPSNRVDPSGYFDPLGDVKAGGGAGLITGIIIVGGAVAIGGVAAVTAPVWIIAIGAGAIVGGAVGWYNESQQGGGTADKVGGAAVGAIAGGLAVCAFRALGPKPPSSGGPTEVQPPPTTPPGVWPPAPTVRPPF